MTAKHVFLMKVSAATADYLAKCSGGNLLVLQGLIAGAQEMGSLREIDLVWPLGHRGTPWELSPREFAQREMNHLQPDFRQLSEMPARS